MKNFTLTLLTAAALIGFSMSANAQDSGSTTTEATVITPIAISSVNPLNFGDIVGTANGGTVTVAPDGSRSSSVNDLIIAGTQTGTVSAASFTVTGQDTYTYTITLPAAFDVVHATDATALMGVGTFTSTPSGTGTLTGGTETVTVGATLSVGTNQAPGVYSHADGLSVTVQYN